MSFFVIIKMKALMIFALKYKQNWLTTSISTNLNKREEQQTSQKCLFSMCVFVRRLKCVADQLDYKLDRNQGSSGILIDQMLLFFKPRDVQNLRPKVKWEWNWYEMKQTSEWFIHTCTQIHCDVQMKLTLLGRRSALLCRGNKDATITNSIKHEYKRNK